MGRRKRKQQSYKRVKRVPKIFTCPECGEKSVKVEKTNRTESIILEDGEFKDVPVATVKCGYCELTKDVLIGSISEPVDAFGDFIDIYYADQEIQRLEKRIAKLKADNEWGELTLCYSILVDLCVIKVEIIAEMDDADVDEASKWRSKAQEYRRLEKDALLKMESEELERGIKTDDESVFTEDKESKIKREKKAEDVFDDVGFLEF